MLYYSAEARESAIKKIDDLNCKIGSIPGNYLNYTDAVELGRFLSMLKDVIVNEEANRLSNREYVRNAMEERENVENKLKNLKSFLESAVDYIDEYFEA